MGVDERVVAVMADGVIAVVVVISPPLQSLEAYNTWSSIPALLPLQRVFVAMPSLMD